MIKARIECNSLHFFHYRARADLLSFFISSLSLRLFLSFSYIFHISPPVVLDTPQKTGSRVTQDTDQHTRQLPESTYLNIRVNPTPSKEIRRTSGYIPAPCFVYTCMYKTSISRETLSSPPLLGPPHSYLPHSPLQGGLQRPLLPSPSHLPFPFSLPLSPLYTGAARGLNLLSTQGASSPSLSSGSRGPPPAALGIFKARSAYNVSRA